jgi:hypothetical protein
VREGEVREMRAIERAVGAKDRRAEVFGDGVEDRLAGLHHDARNGVGLEYVEAAFAQDGGDCGFTAAETAGEACAQHGSPIDTPRKVAGWESPM